MSESKYTPGPWAVHPDDARVDAFVGGNPYPICLLLWPSDMRSEAETYANARLIAAAPTMLAALEAASGYLLNAKIDLETGVPKRTAIQTINGGLSIIRAAIAQAKGETE